MLLDKARRAVFMRGSRAEHLGHFQVLNGERLQAVDNIGRGEAVEFW